MSRNSFHRIRDFPEEGDVLDQVCGTPEILDVEVLKNDAPSDESVDDDEREPGR